MLVIFWYNFVCLMKDLVHCVEEIIFPPYLTRASALCGKAQEHRNRIFSLYLLINYGNEFFFNFNNKRVK